MEVKMRKFETHVTPFQESKNKPRLEIKDEDKKNKGKGVKFESIYIDNSPKNYHDKKNLNKRNTQSTKDELIGSLKQDEGVMIIPKKTITKLQTSKNVETRNDVKKKGEDRFSVRSKKIDTNMSLNKSGTIQSKQTESNLEFSGVYTRNNDVFDQNSNGDFSKQGLDTSNVPASNYLHPKNLQATSKRQRLSIGPAMKKLVNRLNTIQPMMTVPEQQFEEQNNTSL